MGTPGSLTDVVGRAPDWGSCLGSRSVSISSSVSSLVSAGAGSAGPGDSGGSVGSVGNGDSLGVGTGVGATAGGGQLKTGVTGGGAIGIKHGDAALALVTPPRIDTLNLSV